jgi:paraquat-inducible protein A
VKYQTALRSGLLACPICGRLSPRPPGFDSHAARRIPAPRCPRCDAALHGRRPDSVARTWALLIAAALLYIPANLLPILHTASIFGSQDDTIMSGIVYFWSTGEWPLACIVFIASILVPLLKLVTLSLLAWTTQHGSSWRPQQRTRLYRTIEKIGRWSMLDVFVITLTVALVHFQSIATITAGPGALAFACVVVLTMLASMSFDPRLIWDTIENTGPHHE